jgi:hypothetical protein
MSRGNLGLWMCAGVLLGVTAHAGAQDKTLCESDDACAQGTFCSGEGYDAGGSDDDLGSDDDGSGDGTDTGPGTIDPPDGPTVIPGQCVPLLTGFCEHGAGCADGLTCMSGSSSPDGCEGPVGSDDGGDTVADGPTDPAAGCEPVEGRYGSCELPEVECASDDDCGAGLRCVVTGESGGCDSEDNCEFVDYKSCVYEAKRCDDAACSAGYDCVAQTVPGECTGGDGGCDENGCWTEETDCQPDTVEKSCLIGYRACDDDAACAEGEKCLAFSPLDGDLSVPLHWAVEGPVKSCVPADSVLVAQTAEGLPEARRNVSDAPGWGNEDGDDNDGNIEDEGPIEEDQSADGEDTGGDDGGDGSVEDGPSTPSDDDPASSDDDPSADPSDGAEDDSDGKPKGSSCSVGFAGNDVSSLASIMLALGLTVRRRRRR